MDFTGLNNKHILILIAIVFIFNIACNCFMYVSLRNRKGPRGPQGVKGNRGNNAS